MRSSFAHEQNRIGTNNEREIRETGLILDVDVVKCRGKKKGETDNLHDETESGSTGSETSCSSNEGVNDVIDYETRVTRNMSGKSPQNELIFPATLYTVSEMILASRSVEAWKLSLEQSETEKRRKYRKNRKLRVQFSQEENKIVDLIEFDQDFDAPIVLNQPDYNGYEDYHDEHRWYHDDDDEETMTWMEYAKEYEDDELTLLCKEIVGPPDDDQEESHYDSCTGYSNFEIEEKENPRAQKLRGMVINFVLKLKNRCSKNISPNTLPFYDANHKLKSEKIKPEHQHKYRTIHKSKLEIDKDHIDTSDDDDNLITDSSSSDSSSSSDNSSSDSSCAVSYCDRNNYDSNIHRDNGSVSTDNSDSESDCSSSCNSDDSDKTIKLDSATPGEIFVRKINKEKNPIKMSSENKILTVWDSSYEDDISEYGEDDNSIRPNMNASINCFTKRPQSSIILMKKQKSSKDEKKKASSSKETKKSTLAMNNSLNRGSASLLDNFDSDDDEYAIMHRFRGNKNGINRDDDKGLKKQNLITVESTGCREGSLNDETFSSSSSSNSSFDSVLTSFDSSSSHSCDSASSKSSSESSDPVSYRDRTSCNSDISRNKSSTSSDSSDSESSSNSSYQSDSSSKDIESDINATKEVLRDTYNSGYEDDVSEYGEDDDSIYQENNNIDNLPDRAIVGMDAFFNGESSHLIDCFDYDDGESTIMHRFFGIDSDDSSQSERSKEEKLEKQTFQKRENHRCRNRRTSIGAIPRGNLFSPGGGNMHPSKSLKNKRPFVRGRRASLSDMNKCHEPGRVKSDDTNNKDGANKQHERNAFKRCIKGNTPSFVSGRRASLSDAYLPVNVNRVNSKKSLREEDNNNEDGQQYLEQSTSKQLSSRRNALTGSIPNFVIGESDECSQQYSNAFNRHKKRDWHASLTDVRLNDPTGGGVYLGNQQPGQYYEGETDQQFLQSDTDEINENNWAARSIAAKARWASLSDTYLNGESSKKNPSIEKKAEKKKMSRQRRKVREAFKNDLPPLHKVKALEEPREPQLYTPYESLIILEAVMASNPLTVMPSLPVLKEKAVVDESPKESEKQNNNFERRKEKETVNDATIHHRRDHSKILRSTKVKNLPPDIRERFKKRLIISNESKTIKNIEELTEEQLFDPYESGIIAGADICIANIRHEIVFWDDYVKPRRVKKNPIKV